MKNETFGGMINSHYESFSKIKEKLFGRNSNLPSNDVSSMMEKDEEDNEDDEEENEMIKNSSINNISAQNDENSSEKDNTGVINSVVSYADNKTKIYSKTEIKEKILMIFKNFSSYSKEEKQFLITQQSLIKILKKVNILDGNKNHLKLNELDLLFRKVNPNPHSSKFNEKQFFNFIIKLAEKIFVHQYKQNPKTSVSLLFSENLDSICDEIVKEKNIFDSDNTGLSNKFIESILRRPISNEMIDILISIYPTIKEIYLKYFNCELSSFAKHFDYDQKLKDESLKSLENFCKDFEIVPYVLNFNQLVIYNTIINEFEYSKQIIDPKKDLGHLYTLSKFFFSFIHFSYISYAKNNKLSMNKFTFSDVDKLLFFLDKLENSNVFKNFERKVNKPHSVGLTLIPTKYFLSRYDKNSGMEEIKKDIDIRKDNYEYIESICDCNFLKINDDSLKKLNSKIPSIKKIFLNYCKIGDQFKEKKMNFTSFYKFLKDCKLIAEISEDIKKSSKISNYRNTNNSHTSKNKQGPYPKGKDENYVKLLTKTLNGDNYEGKLSECDVNIIFSKLTGSSNLDGLSDLNINKKSFINSEFSSSFEESVIKGYVLEKTKMNKIGKISTSKSINFSLFIKSFELISVKLYPKQEIDLAFSKFYYEHLEKFVTDLECILEQKDDVYKHTNIFDNPEVRGLIHELRPIFIYIFEMYSDKNEFINFQSFFEFFKDFDLYPQVVNLLQLKSLFNMLIRNMQKYEVYYTNSSKVKSISRTDPKIILNNDFINFDIFIQSLPITASFLNFDSQITDDYKILYLIEIMNKSNGLVKLQKKMGNTNTSSKDFQYFFHKIKEKYPRITVNNKSLETSDLFSYVFDS